jgi:SulP family sulfate permease
MPLLSHEDGVAVVRLDGGLFFATAEALDDRIRELARREGLETVVLNLEAVNFIDSQGAAKLAELRDLLARDGVDLRLDRVKPQVRDVLEADGFALSAA